MDLVLLDSDKSPFTKRDLENIILPLNQESLHLNERDCQLLSILSIVQKGKFWLGLIATPRMLF